MKKIIKPVADNVYYDKNDLGLTLKGNDNSIADFKTWAPLASSVQLLLFKDYQNLDTPDTEPISLTKQENGVWSASNIDVKQYKYYKYRITNNGITSDIADIHSKCDSPDSVASQIADINTDIEALPQNQVHDLTYGTQQGYYNPFGLSGNTKKTYTQAVIYEMHVRDWSRAEVTDSTGKYLDIANSKAIMNHLKDLGVTHVQLLPVFEYAEKNDDISYNWGYNPYQYNVPEGRYATHGYTDGRVAVKELRTLIARFHENGIAVNMDVVYNHTSSTLTSSLYDQTVPQYYYRVSPEGNYYNGSGCGNEINTGAPMVKKYIIDSLKHWMLDYHFNGFRFDLMGVFERSTMKEIYQELYKIDPNVMVYGEPWVGGDCAVKDGFTSETKKLINQSAPNKNVNGVACFDDDFRDAIKGAEFGGFKQGQAQGVFNDQAICKGLTGSQSDVDVIGRYINYAECHDNYTLFDKLAISYLDKTDFNGDLVKEIGEEGMKEVIKEDLLAFSYIILAQGTPFINGGQEFLRTKQGDENSYISSDSINQINLKLKDTYSKVYNTYKALIAFRKQNEALFGNNKKAKAITLDKGITKYTSGDYTIYFNATSMDYSIKEQGHQLIIDQDKGTFSIEVIKKSLSLVKAKDFLIIKQAL